MAFFAAAFLRLFGRFVAFFAAAFLRLFGRFVAFFAALRLVALRLVAFRFVALRLVALRLVVRLAAFRLVAFFLRLAAMLVLRGLVGFARPKWTVVSANGVRPLRDHAEG